MNNPIDHFFEPPSHEIISARPPSAQDLQSATNAEQGPTRKRKREKYGGKACGPCQKRKIKCGGGSPCGPCVRRKRHCRATAESLDGHDFEVASLTGEDSRTKESMQGLHERLAALESHLANLSRALLPVTPVAESSQPISGPSSDTGRFQGSTGGEKVDAAARDAATPQDGTGASPKDHLCFASRKNRTTVKNSGETSVIHALQRVEDRLGELGLPVVERTSAPGTPPMTPLPSNSRGLSGGSRRHRVLRALQDNGITPSRKEWDGYLDTFWVEVHPLYPFSHEPQIAETYELLWEILSSPNCNESSQDIDLDRIFQLLLMLALGRCTVSSRTDAGQGMHSAGWSLYCTAMDLQDSHLDTVNDDSKPLSSLHSLTLVVIYLMRLDATERAQKILSLAIIHAQQLGIHLSQTHSDMSSFESELFKRVWWCLYVLDRRVALVLGRPFIIQDNNIKVGLPKDFEVATPGFSRGSVLDFFHMNDDQPATPSPIYYLNVMAGYSKLVGKVWETLFGAESSTQSGPHIHEYLESLVHNWMNTVPNFLVCDHENVHQTKLRISSTLFKQRFLIQLRFLYILILIKSPMKRTPDTSTWSNNIHSETICLQHARHIVNMFSQCTVADGVHGFPFLPYLLEVTITILAYLTRLPTLKVHYRETVETALEMLTQFCKKSWVSGKIARMIFKLRDIIPRVFEANAAYTDPMHLGSAPRPDHGTNTNPHSCVLQGSSDMRPTQPDHRIQSHSPSNQPLVAGTMWRMDPSQGNGGQRPEVDGQIITSIADNQAAQRLGGENTNQNFQPFMIADFPFELNFGNTVSQAIAPSRQATLNNDDFSGPFRSAFDLDWLDELIPIDSRFLAPS